PMGSADGRVWLVFNGEIYNFPELRTELEAKGYSFRSHSDTEVILAGYLAWGEKILNRLRGMFAIAIWDARTRRLMLARDRIG
ncbi:asparagine synthetase B, partial [Escherichia coli]|nr:asparagine synthetase B [Escherichia coli]